MKNPWIIIGVIAVVLIGGSVWYSQHAAATYNEGVELPEVQVKGNPEAAVVLTEYSDFQCPACAQFQPIVNEIVDAYSEQLRFEYRHFPLIQIHPNAEAAARAAEAAGQQGKFFEFHDLLFANQTTWSASPNAAGFFNQYAEDLGLDTEKFSRHQRSSLIRDHVRAQFTEAREQGLTGTPSFFLNGQPMEISTYDDFRAQIEAALGVGTPASSTASSTLPVIEFGI